MALRGGFPRKAWLPWHGGSETASALCSPRLPEQQHRRTSLHWLTPEIDGELKGEQFASRAPELAQTGFARCTWRKAGCSRQASQLYCRGAALRLVCR